MNKGARHTWYVTRRFAAVATWALFFTTVVGVLAAPIMTVTKTATLLVDNNSDGKVTPGDRLRYTVRITNTGNISGTNVVFSDTLDANTTLVSGSVKTSPVAVNNDYSAIGNVGISISATNGLLVNDFGIPAPTVVSASGSSANGGTFTVNSDGSFSYDPPAGYTGADTFTYSLNNANGSDIATVTINISGTIWFVNNAPGACSSGCDGRLSHPFTSLDAFRAVNDGTGNHPAANDAIFIYESATNYTLTSPLTLLTNQQLIGQDSSATLQALTSLTPPLGSAALPAVNSANGTHVNITSPSVTAISLGTDNGLYGFALGQSSLALSGTSFGALFIRDVSINTTGAAMMLSTGTADAIFSSVTASGGSNNVSLNANGSLDLGTGSLSGASGTAFLVSGGNASITYTGSLDSAARSVNISGKTGGSVIFNGPVNGTGTGVYLASNTGTTISFNSGTNLSTAANDAFYASANTGGAVSVMGTNNSLTTTTGTALRIENTTIGAGGLTFRSITSNGGSNPGIRLNNTGVLGGLIVTGDGGSSNNSSGGTIQSKTVNGVELLSTQGVSLRYMNIHDNDGSGIYGDSLTNFTLFRSNVQSNSDTFDGSEANLRFGTLLGNSAITTSTISGSVYDNIRLTPSSGTLNLTISGSTIGPNSATTGNNGITVIGTSNATVNLTVNGNSLITGNQASGLLTSFSDTSIQNITLINSTLTNNNIGVDLGGTSTSNWRFNVSGNTLTGHTTDAIFIVADSTSTSTTAQGTINNNVIGNGTADSGARDQYGIHVSQRESAQLIVAITNNTVRNTDYEGILIRSGDIAGPSGRMDLTLTGNTVSAPDDNSGFPVLPNGILVGSRRTSTLCANIANNSSAGVAPGTGYYLTLLDSSSFGLQGYATSVAATLASQGNTGSVGSFGTTFNACTPATPTAAALSAKVLARPNNIVPAAQVQASNIAEPQVSSPQATQHPSTQAKTFTYVTASQPQQSWLTGIFEKSLNGPLSAGNPVTVGAFILPPGKSITIAFDTDVDTPVAPGVDQVRNQGQASGSNFSSVSSDDPSTLTANDATITQLDIKADLVLAKTDGNINAVPGDTISYTLTYTNAGPDPAVGAIITETVPANTTFNDASNSTDWNCTPNGSAGSTCTFSIGQLLLGDSGSIVFATTVTNPAPAGVTQISNSASIGSATTDPVTSTNTASDITPVDASPDLLLVKSADVSVVTPGGAVTYTLVLTNVGNQDATGVVLTETVPANSTYNASASSIGWSCPGGGVAGSLCTLSAGNVSGGASVTRQFAATVANPVSAGAQSLDNQAVVADDGTNGSDLTPGNNVATATTPIDAQVVMTLTLNDGGITVRPGESITYTLFYTNSGDMGTSGFVLTETVPANTAFNPTASTQGWSCAPDNSAGSVCTLNPGSLNGGASGSATFGVSVSLQLPLDVTYIFDTASLGDDGSNGASFSTSGDGTASDTTPLELRADLEISKFVEPASAVSGEPVTYTIYYTNYGPQPSGNVIISDAIPSFLTNTGVSATSYITLTGSASYIWSAGVLQPGQGGTITLTGIISPNLDQGGRFTNTVNITGTSEVTPGNNMSAAGIDISVPQIRLSSASYAVAENAGPAIITASVAPAPVIPVSVNYATSNGTALSSSDYAPISGSLTFMPGQTTLTFTVSITDDNIYEKDESLNVMLSTPVNSNISSPASAALTIQDNEVTPTVHFDAPDFNIGEADGHAIITLTLSNPSVDNITVNAITGDGSASSQLDYAPVDTLVQFPPLATIVTFSVPITDDLIYETNETVLLTLSNPSNATIGTPAQATLTIADDEALPTVQFGASGESVSEAGGAAIVTVTLDHASVFTITANISSTDETASDLKDYVPISTAVSFTPSMTLAQFSVPITNDVIYEGNETFGLSLTDPVSATLGTPITTQVTIVDDDPAPIVQFSGAPYSASESAGSAPITITLDRVSVFTVTAILSSTNDTAIAPADYTPISQVVSFAPGEITQTINLILVNNSLYEPDRMLWLGLSDPTSAITGGTNPVQFTIVNDDLPPTVQFSSNTYSVGEADGPAIITVTLSNPSVYSVTVNATSSDGSASAKTDYAFVDTQVQFPPLATLITFSVPITDDLIYETSEMLSLTLSNPSNAVTGTLAQAILTIADNEALPTVQFGASGESASEAAGAAVVTATLDHASVFTITANISSTDETASNLKDYLPISSVVSFSPGMTLAQLSVPITNDLIYEGNETFGLDLADPVSATLGTPITTQVTIADDDPAPVVQFSGTPYSANESSGSVPVTVTIDRVSVFTVTAILSSTNGTASAPDNYTPISQVVSFAPGVVTQTVNLTLLDNSLYELDKTFWLGLSDPTGGITGGVNPVQFTVVNDDLPPMVQFSSATYTAGETDAQAAITVTLNTPSGLQASAAYTISNGSASSPEDYLAGTGVLTFTPGETSQRIDVTLIDDAFYDGNETVHLALGEPVSATLSTPVTATLTITDNETQPVVQFSSSQYNVTESDLEAPITVTLSGPSAFTVTVGYATADGSALHASDYVSASGELTFTPGITTQVFAVDIISDSIAEPLKALNLSLSNPTNTSLGGLSTATLTIRDDDPYMVFLPIISFPAEPTVQFTATTYTASENVGNASISAMLNWRYPLTITVRYTASNGRATAPGDYGAVSGTLVFAPGTAIQSFNVPIVNDALYESNETVLLSLGEPMSNTTAGAITTATLTILNDDPMPAVQFSSTAYTATESTGVGYITATLSAPAGITATVRYTTNNGTATAPGDYLAATGTLTFAPGVTTQLINIHVVTDTLREAVETMSVTLGNAVNAILGSPASATLFINDDTAPDLIVQSVVASGNQVTVVIHNIGSAAVVDEFWVDAYINPITVPTHVNQLWSSIGTRGLAWGVTSSSLPLAPGAALTLTVNGVYYSAPDSNMGGSIATGTPVYAQVDSVNLQTTYGNVLETHELAGRPYNNITGPAGLTMIMTTELPEQSLQATTAPGEAARLPSRQ